jgi:hypothetical protein
MQPNEYGRLKNRHEKVYASGVLENISILKIIDSPFAWGAAGFVIGAALGVTTLSVWLVAIGLGAFLLYLRLHGPAEYQTEGRLFAAGPAYIVSWMLGFIVRGLLL